ncbi:hypothetical protein AAF712_001620 [Marasmius tenuissimus]|uniref:Uncharacterized protein n=1 Tax=Marasmius tenuissimus TaxID=585030 RepID=A0ABR3ACG6_9AGAR
MPVRGIPEGNSREKARLRRELRCFSPNLTVPKYCESNTLSWTGRSDISKEAPVRKADEGVGRRPERKTNGPAAQAAQRKAAAAFESKNFEEDTGYGRGRAWGDDEGKREGTTREWQTVY